MGEFRHNSHYEQYKTGDRIKVGQREAVLLSDAFYKSTRSWGLFFAEIMWDDMTINDSFMICRNDLTWKPLSEVEDATWTEVKEA
jgi:hypothetical protein